jgi:hypothetical protein
LKIFEKFFKIWLYGPKYPLLRHIGLNLAGENSYIKNIRLLLKLPFPSIRFLQQTGTLFGVNMGNVGNIDKTGLPVSMDFTFTSSQRSIDGC